MKIGIIVAMDKEFAQLKTLLTESQVERKNYKDFVIGKIGNNEVVMQQCGIGKVNSTIGAVEMIDNYHPDLVISSGVAGGADINLNVTEVVVATNCVYHDAYCGEECEFGQILGMPASFKSKSVVSKGGRCTARRETLRVIFGGLPSSTFMSMSTGLLPKWRSDTVRWPSAVAVPSTAKGQRSRSQKAWNVGRLSGAIAST